MVVTKKNRHSESEDFMVHFGEIHGIFGGGGDYGTMTGDGGLLDVIWMPFFVHIFCRRWLFWDCKYDTNTCRWLR